MKSDLEGSSRTPRQVLGGRLELVEVNLFSLYLVYLVDYAGSLCRRLKNLIRHTSPLLEIKPGHGLVHFDAQNADPYRRKFCNCRRPQPSEKPREVSRSDYETSATPSATLHLRRLYKFSKLPSLVLALLFTSFAFHSLTSRIYSILHHCTSSISPGALAP
ncbi:hypothetical protein DFH11DRAFT_542456 [Phellopilus nigrolimitatus]|nr:hypothetical protein DFH11DRAFT_542456 [Phellopilus nigrolimitatus]